MYGELRGKIKTLEILEEAREKKEKRNNIIIKMIRSPEKRTH